MLLRVLAVLGLVAAYELLRWFLLRRLERRLRAGALRFVRRHRVHLEAARFIDRVWVRQALLADPQVDAAVVEAARAEGRSLAEVRARVEDYAAEIAPAFSLTAYYRLGAWLARIAVRFCYETVFDRAASERALARIPRGAAVVFVVNHRSNADYVVLSYLLLRQVALSYAVGEWARVWPLDILFRAFGSYFVRRGEKDPLYHRVLERYVQLLVAQGAANGFFIEGRLSRDGRLGRPKAGLLDYILGTRREHPELPIFFVPAGIAYDRVLEDRSLLAERRAPTAGDKLRSLAHILLRLPVLVAANTLRIATRSHRKLGYAAVTVGQPIPIERLQGEVELAALPRDRRRPLVEGLARTLLDAIGRVVPATPVCLLALALREHDGEASEAALVRRVRELLAALRRRGAPIALGRAFRRPAAASAGIPGVDDEVSALGEAELVVALATTLLLRRRLLRREGQALRVEPGARPLLDTYANAIEHHLAQAAS